MVVTRIGIGNAIRLKIKFIWTITHAKANLLYPKTENPAEIHIMEILIPRIAHGIIRQITSFHDTNIFIYRYGFMIYRSLFTAMAAVVYKLVPLHIVIINAVKEQSHAACGIGQLFLPNTPIMKNNKKNDVIKSAILKLVTNALVEVWSLRENNTANIIMVLPIMPKSPIKPISVPVKICSQ